jgi:predicted nuclease with TOPRIM domain
MAIDSSDNFIDPRDVNVEADEYEDSIALKKEEIEEVEDNIAGLDEDDEDYHDELSDLECQLENLKDELLGLEEEAEDIFELRDECDNYARGETLINEDYWVDYVRQMAEDIDGIDTNNWPYNNIDWEGAADDLRVDYVTITWRGQDFYVRA